MSKNDQYYWSLSIEPGLCQAAIWTIEEQTTKVLAIGPSVKWSEPADLVEAADATLSSTVSSLNDDSVEPSRVVFGVSASWVEQGQIKKEHLDHLRQLCNSLSLTPTGFVVLPEAVAHWVKNEEGAPANAVVIGVADTSVDVSIFKLGNLAGSVNVIKSVSIVEDVVEGLARFALTEPLPSRFLVYNGKEAELEDVRQNLVKADWTADYKDKIKFLHTPSVEVVDPNTKMLAICLAGASEMAQVTEVSFDEPEPADLVSQDDESQAEEELHDADLPEGHEANASDMGFVVNDDIASKDDKEETDTQPSEEDDNISEPAALPRKLGFSLSLVAAKLKSITSKIHIPKIKRASKPASSVEHHVSPVGSKKGFGRVSGVEHKPFIIGMVFLLLLIVAGFAAWWFLPKAEVIIYVAPKQLEKRETLKINTEGQTDFDSKVIHAKTVSLTVDGNKTTSATGKKTIGDKAKGKIQIRNGTAVGIKVNSGTTLFASNDLKFTLDESASVSAAVSPSAPGTAEVAITASSIGSDYNLPKGETMKVGNYPTSEVDAILEEDLTGGSSKEITAVSQSDLDDLEFELKQELIDEANSQFRDEISASDILIEESIQSTTADRSFNAKVGDEAQTVKLTLSLELSALTIPKDSINEFSMKLLESQVPSGFVLRQEQIQTDFKPNGEITDGSGEFELHLVANLLPEVKTEDIARKISGKNPLIAQDYLSTIPGYSRATIRINPTFPGKLAVLPRVASNISIVVSSDQ